MKFILKLLMVVVVVFVGLLIIGSMSETKTTDDREKLCKQWMADAAPGSEKRMTREMCKRLGVEL